MAITANKLLGKNGNGGALIARPTTSLVPYKGIDPIEKSESDSSEKTLFTIQKKIILIDDLLKGTIAEKKKRQKDEKKQKEDEQRKKAESKLEDDATDSDDEDENKLKMPRLSFLDGIKQFISNVLLGWLTFKLIKHLPTIVKFLKPIADIAGFFIKWGGKFLDGVVTFIDWGYKALDATKGWIGDKFGEGAANKFESFMGNLNKMMQGVILIGMAVAKMSGRPRGPRGPRGPKPKWRKALERRWKNSRVGKFFRNNAAARKKLIRKITRPFRRVTRALKPKNIVNTLKNTEIGKKVTERVTQTTKKISEAIKNPRETLKKLQKTKLGQQVTQTTKKISEAVKDPKKALEKLKKTQAGKKVTEIAKKVDPRKWKMPQIKTPGWMKKAGGVIRQGFANADAWIKSIPAKRKALFDTIGKSLTEFKSSQSAKWGARLKKLKNLKPQAAIDKLTAKIRPHIDDILNKNPIIKKLVTNLKPANAKGSIRGLLTKAANNPLLKKLINTLKSNKAATKGLGPVDKIIAALMALWDYNKGGESPINAIVKGLGGLLGWTAGFSAATAVPVLGQSGIFNFMGGMAGSWAGDEIGKILLRGLAKTPLADIEDPIMGSTDIENGLPARKLVRDPDSIIGDTESQDPTVGVGGGGGSKEGGTEEGSGKNITAQGNAENIVPLDVNSVKKKTDDVSVSASYEDDSGDIIVVEKGSQEEGIPEIKPKETLTPIAVGGGGGNDDMGERLYKGG